MVLRTSMSVVGMYRTTADSLESYSTERDTMARSSLASDIPGNIDQGALGWTGDMCVAGMNSRHM